MRDSRGQDRWPGSFRCRRGAGLFVWICATCIATHVTLLGGDPTRLPLDPSFGQLPLTFEQIEGVSAQFLCHGLGYGAFLSPGEIVLVLKSGQSSAVRSGSGRGSTSMAPSVQDGATVRIKLQGSNPKSLGVGLQALSAPLNYLIGNDPARWRQVSAYSQIRFTGVYPGIDLIYYGNQRQLESDFVVRAGADPGQILFGIEGAERVELDRLGDLIVQTGAGPLRQRRPVVYQEIHGQRTEVTSRYVLNNSGRNGTAAANPTVSLEVGSYRADEPLIIDPVLVYSGLLGGIGDDVGWSVAVDPGGNTVIVGETTSINFPVTNAIYPFFHPPPVIQPLAPQRDVFIAKVGPSGTNLIFATYLGGTQDDAAYKVVLDGDGNIYLAGQTSSTNFPVTLDAVSRNLHGTNILGYYKYDAFVTKLDAGGSNLLYSTYLGGGLDDVAVGIAVDSADDVYVTGFTSSPDFPTVNSPPPVIGGGRFDAFVTKLTARDSSLIYSVVFGGFDDDRAQAVGVDAAGNAVVAGYTRSDDFPVTPNAVSTNLHGIRDATTSLFPYDAFVTKFSADGAAMIYSTFLGGTRDDEAFNLAVDAAGNAYVTGFTDSTNFPVQNALYPTNSGSSDVFVTELDGSGTNLVYSTYFGGSGIDEGWGIALGGDGSASVVGSTTSTNFVETERIQLRPRGASDVFLFGLAPGGVSLLYSVALGGTGDDIGNDVALDTAGNAILTGKAASSDFPLLPSTNGLPHTFVSGLNDAFLVKIYPGNLFLSAQAAGGNDVAITWPALFSNYGLQYTDTLIATNVWTTATNPTAVVGTNLVVTYTNTVGNSFYRLQPRP